MFCRGRFKTLLRVFHLVDSHTLAKPGEPGYDPCGRFSMLVEQANRVFRTHYTPHRELSVDESLVGTKSHTAITQCLPNKHRLYHVEFSSVLTRKNFPSISSRLLRIRIDPVSARKIIARVLKSARFDREDFSVL